VEPKPFVSFLMRLPQRHDMMHHIDDVHVLKGVWSGGGWIGLQWWEDGSSFREALWCESVLHCTVLYL
jgi:hypothetical protein